MMYWTTKQPTKIGWYWIKEKYTKGSMSKITTIDIVYIRNYDRKLCIGNWIIPESTILKKIEWAGPIPLPAKKIKRRKK